MAKLKPPKGKFVATVKVGPKGQIIVPKEVRDMFLEMHQYYDRKYTPKVKYTKACNSCSLKDLCLPRIGRTVSVKAYMDERLREENE